MINKLVAIGISLVVVIVLLYVSRNVHENYDNTSKVSDLQKELNELQTDLKENNADIKCPADISNEQEVDEKGCPVCPPAQKEKICPKCPELSNYVLKSEIPGCPDMSQYVLKSEVPSQPDMSQYILKSEIPTCPDMSEYIKKSEIPPCKCDDLTPMNPVIPVNPKPTPLDPSDILPPIDIDTDGSLPEINGIVTRKFPKFKKPKYSLDNLTGSNDVSQYYVVKNMKSRKVVKAPKENVSKDGKAIKFSFDKVLSSLFGGDVYSKKCKKN